MMELFINVYLKIVKEVKTLQKLLVIQKLHL